MKHTFLKLINLLGFATLMFALPSCLKENDATFTDFSQAGTNLSLMTTNPNIAGQFLPTGLNNLAYGNFDPGSGDSTDLELVAMYNGEFANKSDIPVTFSVNDAKRTQYNLDTASVNGVVVGNNKKKTQFTAMTTSMYKILATSAVIKTGERYVRSIVRIYHAPVIAAGSDKSFMLPVSVNTSASGLTVAANISTLYVNVIGNPISGTYSVVGGRYNCNSVTGDQNWAPQPGWAYPQALVIPANFVLAAIPSPKQLLTLSGDETTTYVANLGAGTDRDYTFKIDPATTGVINANVTLTPSFEGGLSNVRWFQKTYDATNKRFILLWTYNNLAGGVGNDRIIYEVLTKL
ncbi:MAG: DUF1735 domain-containing protein [Ferruginibacter sp.]|nr:DUF1735 domain-containing protein [Ferruginibacter sp.]